MDWRGVDYWDVFISCLDSHSDGTHSLQSIHWWASDVHFFRSVLTKKQTHLHLGWPEGEQVTVLGELFLKCKPIQMLTWTSSVVLPVVLQLIWQTLLFRVTYSLALGLLAPCIADELHKHLVSSQCINNDWFLLFYTAVLIKTSLFSNLFAQKTSLILSRYLPTVFHVGFGRGL